jgi:TRAP-type C4-dicarboxylate transport system substrate-binding protein
MYSKKILIFLAIVTLISVVALTACASSTPVPTAPTSGSPAPATSAPGSTTPAAGKVYKLSYALFQPPTAQAVVTNTEYAKEIEKRSNGQVQITVQPGGSLLNGGALFNGIVNKIADMGNGLTTYNFGAFPFTSIAEMPSAAQSGWVVSHAHTDFIMKYQPKEWNKVHFLNGYGSAYGVAVLGTAKSQIKTLDDNKGKSVRTNDPDIASALGLTVKDVPMAEVYDSVSKGAVDGVLTSPEPLITWKLGDVTKYITLFYGPVMPAVVWYNVINMDTWNSLPPDIQKIFTDVSLEYAAKEGITWDDSHVAGFTYAKKAGDQFYTLPQAEIDKWTALVTPVIQSRMQKVVDKGFTQQEVQDAWTYYQSRVDYWNGQQAANNITPVKSRLDDVIK